MATEAAGEVRRLTPEARELYTKAGKHYGDPGGCGVKLYQAVPYFFPISLIRVEPVFFIFIFFPSLFRHLLGPPSNVA